MNWNDLLRMSINSLRRRKLRTFLTVLGVLIGTASIVVMISLGLGTFTYKKILCYFLLYIPLTTVDTAADNIIVKCLFQPWDNCCGIKTT